MLSAFVSAKTLTVWLTGVNNEVLNIYRDLVEEKFTPVTGIEVEFTNLSWGDFENRFILAAATGDAPDVGGMGPLFAPELGIRGAVIDLRATFPDFDEVVKNLYPAVFRSLSYQGSVFGVHFDANFAMTGFQRDDILQQHGIGSLDTWDDVRKALPKLQANGSNLSLAWQLTTDLYEDVNMFMWQHGGDDYTRISKHPVTISQKPLEVSPSTSSCTQNTALTGLHLRFKLLLTGVCFTSSSNHLGTPTCLLHIRSCRASGA